MEILLKKHFGYDSFRPLQKEIIENVLGGQDSFVLMPTGGGKSLCYQLPALRLPGITLVVSPLIALMKDQVDALKANGVSAEYINSSLDSQQIENILARAANNKIKLIYVAPERFAIGSFQEFLKSIDLSLIAIDEAHCISEWGHDFRPDYRNLSRLKTLFPGIPLIALTATATPKVKEDIVRLLNIKKAKIFISSFDRKNLSLEIVAKKQAFHKLVQILDAHRNDSVIIYCHSRKETEELSENLKLNKFNASAYHAGLEANKRKLVQELFIKDQVNIIVATIAFGMGIDKPDVRLVVHYTFPKTLESYYQEIGRAGRDGLPSRCVLFYTYADTRKHEFFINRMDSPALSEIAQEKLSQVLAFCELTTCRKKYLLKYFNEDLAEEKCDACDICLTKRESFDATTIAQKILSAVIRTGNRFGRNYIIEVLKGKKSQKIKINEHDKLSVFGLAKETAEDDLAQIIKQLVDLNYLQKSEDKFPVLKVSQKGIKFLNDKEKLFLNKPEADLLELEISKSKGLIDYNKDLFQILRHIRKELAEKSGVPPFVIFGDKSLMEMAHYFPSDKNSFAEISGVGTKKLEEFSEIFLKAINAFISTNDIKPLNFPTKILKENSIIMRSEKPKYHQKTKELLVKKIPIDRIAKNQDIKIRTIINHIERLIDAGEKLDLDYLQLPRDRYQTIAKAFEEIGDEKLKPVFEHLKGVYTYDEIALVRVLLRGEF